jgi:hypothetical protein
MNFARWLITLLLFVLASSHVWSQSDSCSLRISLLTCGPGEELYSAFGHSALRVTESSSNTDIIFNYGTFDFDDPDFYKKFVLGKLLYFVSVERFDIFRREYQLENRSIIEQQLSLSCEEKHRLFEALKVNAREENKYYHYEFLFDNCSTRLRDIVQNNTQDSLTFKRILPANAPTFRDMIHQYLDKGGQLWSEFGIDLLLASRIDRAVQNPEAMFLPDYLMKGFDSAVVRSSSLIEKKELILPGKNADEDTSWFTPMVVGVILLVVGLVLAAVRTPWAVRVNNVFDMVYFLILGIMGCFMLFMWFGTTHELCRDNYNILWAFPGHIIAAFFVRSKNVFMKRYFAVTAIVSLLYLALSPIIPQGMNSAFIPLIALAAIRGAYRAFKK